MLCFYLSNCLFYQCHIYASRGTDREGCLLIPSILSGIPIPGVVTTKSGHIDLPTCGGGMFSSSILTYLSCHVMSWLLPIPIPIPPTSKQKRLEYAAFAASFVQVHSPINLPYRYIDIYRHLHLHPGACSPPCSPPRRGEAGRDLLNLELKGGGRKEGRRGGKKERREEGKEGGRRRKK